MKKIYLVSLLLAACWPAHAQIAHPGGVTGVSVWNVAAQDPAGRYGWTDMLGGSSVKARSGARLNDHSSTYFDGDNNTFTVPLKKTPDKSFCVFIVYRHTKDNDEQTVWSVENEAGTALVMTTRRLGNLEQYEYINYAQPAEPQYRIFTYTLNEPGQADENLSFKIGRQPTDKSIPVKNFKGYIPEIILYNRSLNHNERQRVESYLAVKYGISLDQTFPTSYLNSAGHRIWDANREPKYNRNITAIGRDDRSGLLQTSSTSSREPGLLQLSLAGKEALPDNHFLVWADNGGDLRFIPQKGQWKQTGRQWKITGTEGEVSKWNVALEFDLDRLSNRYLDKGERYALMIDHSGSGTFPVGQVSVVAANAEKDRLYFPGIAWSGENGKAEIFSLVTVPELFARCGVDNPACGQKNGALQVEILGGTPPYSIQLTGEENTTAGLPVTTNTALYTVPAIAQGDYLLQIKDNRGLSFSEAIRVESIESQHIPMASDYVVKQGESVALSVPSSATGFHRWQLPDGQISYLPEIDAAEAGAYYLFVRNSEGCESSKRIDVASVHSVFSRLHLYPNPTADGSFRLDIGLYQEAEVDLKIYNATGGLVGQSRLAGSSWYLYKGSLPQTGHYIIRVTSQGMSESLKMIRN